MGGCCEASRDYQFNKRTEMRTRLNQKQNEEQTHQIGNMESNNILMKDDQSIQSQQHDNDNQLIPQTKEVKIPSMKIPADIIEKKRQLQLKIFESKFLPEGRILTINPGGLIGSERNAKDGLTIFGINNCEFINDFNFPEEESNIGKRHFEIKYDISTDEYKIKNIAGGGLYIKITNKMILRNNSIFSFSSIIIHTSIAFDSNNPQDNSIIKLRVVYGLNEGKEIIVNSKDKTVIQLGRLKGENIDMDFKDESISRLQTTIIFDKNNWYILDGDGNKQSLNGTWYFAEEYTTLTEGMIFRAGSTSFITHLYYNSPQ